MSGPIRLLIVEDSADLRKELAQGFASDLRFEVLPSPTSARQVLSIAEKSQAAAVVLNWNFEGPELTRQLSAERGLPVIVLVEKLDKESDALREGAISVYATPRDPQQFLELRDHVALMSQVRVIRRRLRPRSAVGPISVTRKVVGIAASTGGPAALLQLLGSLPKDLPTPILLVQHIAPEFSDGFVDWLNQQTPLQVVNAKSDQHTLPGRVYVAPAGYHLSWNGHMTRLVKPDDDCWQVPSADVLFRSLARQAGSRAVGVLLTGLGEDGAAGLLEMKEAGAWTITQDQATSVVYGMPRAAQLLGASCEELSLDRIGSRLLELLVSDT